MNISFIRIFCHIWISLF